MGERVGSLDSSAIWEEEEFLRALVENTSEGLLTIDRNRQILFANPAIEEILGYEPAELIGSSKMKIIPERLRSVHDAGLNQYLESGEKHIDWTGVELPALHKEGYEVPVSVSFREHEYDGERLFTGIFTDITEQKRREQQLRTQKQDLEELADVLSHDLRNPLSVAKGYTDLLLEDGEPADEVEQIADALDRIDQILEDTVTATLQNNDETGSTEVMPFSDVLRLAWESVPTSDAKLVLPAPEWKIRAHEGRLAQLIENLVRNAVDHVGRDVTVRIGILEDAIGFYVEDDGPGLPETIKVQLETPSGLTRERGQGYGLQIVERITDEHGWELHITDAESGGARFEFHGASVFQ